MPDSDKTLAWDKIGEFEYEARVDFLNERYIVARWERSETNPNYISRGKFGWVLLIRDSLSRSTEIDRNFHTEKEAQEFAQKDLIRRCRRRAWREFMDENDPGELKNEMDRLKKSILGFNIVPSQTKGLKWPE